LLLLSGCRRNEIGMLRHSEINDADHTITIPASRSKNKKPHVIPLSPLMRDILSSVKTNGSDQVFCKGRGLPWSRIKARLDAQLKFETPWVLHDLRRTFSTGCTALGVRPDVVEATLNHVSGTRGGVAGTYNRHHFFDEKKQCLALWSDHVLGLVEGRAARVVPIKRRGARVA